MEKTSDYHFSADLIRAIAIVFVIVIHVLGEFLQTMRFFQTPDWWFANIIDSAVRIAVPLFIMLSGFLILNENKVYTTKQFFSKRIKRIGLPLLFWPIFYHAWDLFVHNATFSFHRFFDSYIFLGIFYHLYFLYIIAGLYVLTPILKIALGHGSKYLKNYMLYLTLIFSFVFTLLHYYQGTYINLASAFTIFIPYIAYYLAGNHLGNKHISKKKMFLLGFIYLILTGATAILNNWNMVTNGWSNHADPHTVSYDRYFFDHFSITVLPMSIIAFIILMNLNKMYTGLHTSWVSGIIKQLAKVSFGIYLIHPFFLSMANVYFGFAKYTFTPLWLFLIIKIILLFTVSYLFVYFACKIPKIRLLFN